ncbi:nitrogenase [Fischerella thermalis CCMEE 5268]|uniref:Nitrogenase n=1 Tax=Fischerella thermalis CCMEE 5268 TaxID=2019662 RepID=A0A2N6KHI8_9CYAN|nr:Mo-dependent nitrogenase C-terminal domain-containing protein [Fischerella thermalis]PLZ98854.1 nitrogenase [Fischerella thermalis CCMEE 5268]
MKVFDNTTKKIFFASWVALTPTEASNTSAIHSHHPASKPDLDILQPLRRWLDRVKVSDRQFAHRLCHLIPAQCPFERDVKLFGKTLFHIPPMCKLNPLYEEVMSLRFRALCYLADECGEDVSQYC